MNPYDDVDPDDRYPTRTTQHFLCAKCSMNLVLKLGDYCMTCAVIPPPSDEYIVLSPTTLDRAVEKSGLGREFLKTKMEHTFERNQQYVIFRRDGKWHDLIVHDRFPLRVVMKRLFERLSKE